MKESQRNDGPLDKKGLANYFKVTTRTIDNWQAAGIIPFWKIKKVCRYDLEQVKAALDERCGRNRRAA